MDIVTQLLNNQACLGGERHCEGVLPKNRAQTQTAPSREECTNYEPPSLPWKRYLPLRTPELFFLGLSRGFPTGVAIVNFKPDMFSFLNITSLGSDLVAENIDCGFTCLEIPSCFSYNVAAFPDISGKFLCEPLPSDKFNNSDKFIDSLLYHHFSIPVSTNSLLLSLLFLRDQNFSQNSVRSTIVFCTRQFVHDVLLFRIKLAKYTVSRSDYEVGKRKYLMRLMPRENALVLSYSVLKKGYLNTYVSILLSGEVGNILK